MRFHSPTRTVSAILLLMALLLSGCSADSKKKSSGSGGGGSGGSGAPGGDIGQVDNDGFWIAANAPTYPTHMAQDTGFSDFCEIPAGTLDTEINCILDVPEAHLYVTGIDLQYNVPYGMCKHLLRTTYWYYNSSVGIGPSTVLLDRTFNAAEQLTSADCTVDGVGPLPCNSVNFPELNFSVTADASCAYSCCTGLYTMTITDDNTASGGAVETSVEIGSWGTDYGDCLGGAGKTSWAHLGSNDLPIGVIEEVSLSGFNELYELAAPIQNFTQTTRTLANFYTPADHTHDGYVDATVSNLPYAIEPLDDLDGDAINSGNPAYTFYCADEHREIRNVINVYIRDWDTTEEFSLYLATEGVSGNPDKYDLDEDGVNCDGMYGKCNDYHDWDDVPAIDLGGGTYVTTPPSTNAIRNTYFPFDPFD